MAPLTTKTITVSLATLRKNNSNTDSLKIATNLLPMDDHHCHHWHRCRHWHHYHHCRQWRNFRYISLIKLAWAQLSWHGHNFRQWTAIGVNGAVESIGAIHGSPNDPINLNGAFKLSFAIEWHKLNHYNGTNKCQIWQSPLALMMSPTKTFCTI